MKILPDLNEPVSIMRTGNAQRGDRTGTAERTFSDLLQRAESKRETPPAEAGGPLSFPLLPPLSSTQQEALAMGEDTLALLEHFATLLTKPGTDDTALASLASVLSDRAETLLVLRDGLDNQDPLRTAIDALGALTVVESAKIDRGDYGS